MDNEFDDEPYVIKCYQKCHECDERDIYVKVKYFNNRKDSKVYYCLNCFESNFLQSNRIKCYDEIKTLM